MLESMLIYQFTDITIDDIEKATYQEETARAFGDQLLKHGEVQLKNSTTWYFVINDVKVTSKRIDG